MKMKKVKFAAGSVAVLGALVLLGGSGFEEGKAYYRTVAELRELGKTAQGVRVRVGGTVLPGSIVRHSGSVTFDIHENGEALTVRYVGRDPLPDTLVDRASAIAEGYLAADGAFEASHVQAKCASKYEAAYGSGREETY